MRDARRDRRSGAGRGEVDALYLRCAVLIEPGLRPQRIDGRLVDAGARVLLGRRKPGGPRRLSVNSVDARQRREEQRHADADRSGDGHQPDDRLSPAGECEAQAEPGHAGTRWSRPATLPSRTTISRCAYAATRASWVTMTTVVCCLRYAATSNSMTCSPLSESSEPVGSSANRIRG